MYRGCQNFLCTGGVKRFTQCMIELNVHLLVADGIERLFVGGILSKHSSSSCSQLRTCRARFCFFFCFLDKASVVYFKGKLYLSRCKRLC